MNVQEQMSSEALERGVNACIFVLQNTLGLSPLGAVMVLTEAAAFISKQHGITGVTQPIHADTGQPLQAKQPRAGREL